MRRKHHVLAVLVLVAAAASVLVTAGAGVAGSKAKGPSGYVGKNKPLVGSGGGYGESYIASAPTLAHALFNAKLLPSNKAARDLSLAAYGRSARTVDYALALKCW
ncbi:MAG TPA: hypothetical protein VNH40_10770, partial [Gaiellaceae bacterium]|nr:hypothetical protein [Gaiellaceae bacterium]